MFEGCTMVVRVDEATLLAEGATLYADLTFLGQHGVRTIVVAPTPEGARSVVRTINRSSDVAVGLSGADAGMLPAAGTETLGAVQTRLVRTLLDAGYVPVVEPVAIGLGGADIAVAPDAVAGALARAVGAQRAIFFNDAGGVIDATTRMLIEELTPAEALALAEDATCDDGLRVAIRAAALGVRGGVRAAQIVDGRTPHAAIVEVLTARHLGTQVTGSVLTG